MPGPDSHQQDTQNQQDLLQAILQLDPQNIWSPFTALSEQQLGQAEGLCEAEPTTALVEEFWHTLEACWSEHSATTDVATNQPQLPPHLSVVPTALVSQLLERATQLAQTQLSQLDKLVAMAQVMFPDWSVEDLQVLARPYAYAMRDRQESAPLRQDWHRLSQLEQVRLSLAIAKVILEQQNR
jgi:hypothetical protein